MADTLSKRKRSWLMGRVRQSRTLPERTVERFLRQHRIRFRRQHRGLPGTPDITIPLSNIAIFVHGCFWHGHRGCRRSRLPSTRKEFWAEKVRTNKRRDERVRRALRKKGWKVLTIWGCRTESFSNLTIDLDAALITERTGKKK